VYLSMLIFEAVHSYPPILLMLFPHGDNWTILLLQVFSVCHNSWASSYLDTFFSSPACQFEHQGLKRNHMCEKVLSG
jgi:hypothetical protein